MKRLLPCSLIALAFAGCAVMPELDEPECIPVAVATYKTGELAAKASGVAVSLDVTDCVEAALLVSRGAFGGTSVEAYYPVRRVIEREFARVITDNFHHTEFGEEAALSLSVTTMRVLLTQRKGKISSDVSLTVRLLHPDGTRSPLFRKTYRAQSSGPKTTDGTVPQCFYEAVQRIAEDFSVDLSSNWNLVSYFESKSKKGITK